MFGLALVVDGGGEGVGHGHSLSNSVAPAQAGAAKFVAQRSPTVPDRQAIQEWLTAPAIGIPSKYAFDGNPAPGRR